MPNLHFDLDTPLTDIEDCLKKFIKRDDIDIILINQNVRNIINALKMIHHLSN